MRKLDDAALSERMKQEPRPIRRLKVNGSLDLRREGQQQRRGLDLNQDLSKFWRHHERRESNWDLDSRNVVIWNLLSDPQEACQVTA